MSSDLAIIILGMHRSGTSCLAGMLAAAGLATAGDAVRNWDNARGHFEMLDAVRLDEAVLAYSGGHWLSPPAQVRWTAEQAETRDRLLRARIEGRAALLKDPRMLLALPFWRAASVPFHAIGIVRHPLAVARSQESWRGMPLDEGVALWTAHNRMLVEDHARYGYPLVDFDAPREAFIAAVIAACAPFAAALDTTALAAAYEAQLVHHDDSDAPAIPGLDDALALHAQLLAVATPRDRRREPRAFPRAEVAAALRSLAAGDTDAIVHARAALATDADAAAVLVPVVTAMIRHRAFGDATQLVAETAARLDDGLADLLHAKVHLATGDATAATRHLEAACTVAHPFFQARHLLPQALRSAGRHADARAALRRVVTEALYPHGPLATLAEWSWLDGERAAALEEMARAIAAAPLHRRGRIRTRRAEWLVATGDVAAARLELAHAIEEDPSYPRSRDVLASLE